MTTAPARCPDCDEPIRAKTLACPRCSKLVHAVRLGELATRARAEAAQDVDAAIATWNEALTLLPPQAGQRERILGMIRTLEKQQAQAGVPKPSSKAPRWLAAIGGVGLAIWKLKFVLVLVLSKAKLLLLGLTKAKTAFSMLLMLGVYWTVFGWPFALGLVLSIYVHEMGHVAALRQRGIPASAPMFVPGLGAYVRLKAAPETVIDDARVGLAGPWWGLGAAVLAYGLYVATEQPIFAAVAHVGAWINLFNLIPIWQLDGGRSFRSLSRGERAAAALAIGIAWLMTHESLFVLLLLGAVYQAWNAKETKVSDRRGLVAYVFVLAALALLVTIRVPGMSESGLGP